MSRTIDQSDHFHQRILKLIPSEIVLVYLTIRPLLEDIAIKAGDGMTDISITNLVSWIVVILLGILTPFYLFIIEHVSDWKQIFVTTVSFFVWVYSLGGSFLETFGRTWLKDQRYSNWKGYDIHHPSLAAILLALWSLSAVMILSHQQSSKRSQ